MRIVDQDRKIVAPQTQGRIHLRGSIIFKRYHNNKTATDECMLNDGWFDTGDIGYQDEGGNLIISGRRKEVLILNGYVKHPYTEFCWASGSLKFAQK